MEKSKKQNQTVKLTKPTRNARISDTTSEMSKSIPDIHTSFQTFIHLFVEFNGAGSLFLQELYALLNTSSVSKFMPPSNVATISLESHTSLLKTVQEMDSLLLKYCNDRTDNNTKYLTSCILLYIELQCQYHTACKEALDLYCRQITDNCHKHGCGEVLKELRSLGLASALPTDLSQNDTEATSHKTIDKSAKDEPCSSLSRGDSAAASNHLDSRRSDGLATDEDVDNVISLLSGGFTDLEGSLQTPTPAPEPQFDLPTYQTYPSNQVQPQFNSANPVTVPQWQVVNPSMAEPNRPPDKLVLPGNSARFWFPPYANQATNTPHESTDGRSSTVYHTVPANLQPLPGVPTSASPAKTSWPLSCGGLAVNASSLDTAPDSDDLSDDSSTGDSYLATLRRTRPQDLSSDEDLTGHLPLFLRPHSLENLVERGVTSWPGRDMWMNSALLAGVGLDDPTYNNQHKPLQMFYSDPMSKTELWPNPGVQSDAAGTETSRNVAE